jgi:hypothetical protein
MRIQPYKGRDPYDATRVAVYRNLNGQVWSLLALDGKYRGQIVGHAKQLLLDLPVFKVSEAGRQRVIIEHRKNVHAMVAGIISDEDKLPEYLDDVARVTYNPYTMTQFGMADTAFPDPVIAARVAKFDDRGKCWIA